MLVMDWPGEMIKSAIERQQPSGEQTKKALDNPGCHKEWE